LKIAILGGGVAGAALARGLAVRGAGDVTVWDPRPRGEGSTGRALGGFRTQHGSELNIRLSLAARDYFVPRADRIGFEPNGYLYLAEDENVAAELRARADLQRACGLEITHPDPRELVPFLATGDLAATANFCALDGLYRPLRVLDCIVEEAAAAGARFAYETEARLDGTELVVIAAGIWSAELGRRFEVRLDVTALDRGVYQVGPFDWLRPGIPMTLEAGSGYHFRERDGRLLVMGPGDQDSYGHFRDWLVRRAPRAAAPEPELHWNGAYEVTPDHHPLVGETERPGVWASCGFSGHGVMHSPVIGDCLAAMILGQTPPLDISALSPLRTAPLADRTQL
jgi:sarcosine oxidase subunit beta